MSDDRRSVKTYVPDDQKAIWQEHADELGMSQSEFVRTMVQAGRRGFSIDGAENPVEPDPSVSNPGGDDLERRVEAALADGVLSWEELVEALSSNFEDRLEETLESLQDDNRVRYSGREGGYRLVDQ